MTGKLLVLTMYNNYLNIIIDSRSLFYRGRAPRHEAYSHL